MFTIIDRTRSRSIPELAEKKKFLLLEHYYLDLQTMMWLELAVLFRTIDIFWLIHLVPWFPFFWMSINNIFKKSKQILTYLYLSYSLIWKQTSAEHGEIESPKPVMDFIFRAQLNWNLCVYNYNMKIIKNNILKNIIIQNDTKMYEIPWENQSKV